MIAFGQIIAETIAPLAALDASAIDLTEWRSLFARMHFRLEADGATSDQCLTFMIAITQAIDRAPALELTDAERRALRDVLWSVFCAHPKRPYPPVAPRAAFLRHVNFEDKG